MEQYHNLLKDILENGIDGEDRTGTGTRSVFGRMIRFDLNEGFPAITTKALAWKSVVSELIWFLEGSTDERRLAELRYGLPREETIGKTTIWTANADAQGKSLGYVNTPTAKGLGPVYGAQWRDFEGVDGARRWWDELEIIHVDQIAKVIESIKTDPYGRRHIVSAWNVAQLDQMALPPCHYAFQFYVRNGKLSCLWNQRSVDVFLGLPFNIASYALLTHMIANECGLGVGEVIGSLGDTHIYNNHFEQVKEQLGREPYPLPKLEIGSGFDLAGTLNHRSSLDVVDHFKLIDYQHHPALTGKMAV